MSDQSVFTVALKTFFAFMHCILLHLSKRNLPPDKTFSGKEIMNLWIIERYQAESQEIYFSRNNLSGTWRHGVLSTLEGTVTIPVAAAKKCFYCEHTHKGPVIMCSDLAVHFKKLWRIRGHSGSMCPLPPVSCPLKSHLADSAAEAYRISSSASSNYSAADCNVQLGEWL